MTSTEGYEKAIGLLHQSVSPQGFVASPRETDNYRRIWTRDGAVTGLAALLSGVKLLTNAFADTLNTLFRNQHHLGFMPSNVTAEGTSYGGTVGRADNPSWAVIGLCQHALTTGDRTLADQYQNQVEKCFHVLDIWEYNGKHLIYVPQSGDWADEYMYHGYVLSDQLLRVWALRLAGKVYNRTEWLTKADQIVVVVRKNYWNQKGNNDFYAPNLAHQIPSAPAHHWLMGFNPGRVYHHFDLLGNALALLLDIGDKDQSSRVVNYVKDLLAQYRNILPAFYPPISSADPEMAELKNNYAFRFRNFEHQFHNGGLWPVWNGFMAAALVRHGDMPLARLLTGNIHRANEKGEWIFNECLDGKTGDPIGVPYCTWSAAGVVIAENAVKGNSLLFS